MGCCDLFSDVLDQLDRSHHLLVNNSDTNSGSAVLCKICFDEVVVDTNDECGSGGGGGGGRDHSYSRTLRLSPSRSSSEDDSSASSEEEEVQIVENTRKRQWESEEEEVQVVENTRKRQWENNKKILVQPTLFGLGADYPITVSKMTKVDKKTRKFVAKYVRVESKSADSDAGVFKFTCQHCLNEFKSAQGRANHIKL
jgi:hypothetical protein